MTEVRKPGLTLKKGAKDALWVAGGNYFALLAGFPLGFITPAFLLPAHYGVTAVIDLISELLKHFHLGALGTMARELPILRARGEEARALEVRDGVWTFIVCIAPGVIVLPTALARWVFHADETFQVCLLLACVALVLWRLTEVHSILLKTEKRFKDDSRILCFTSLIPLVTLPIGLWLLRLPGYFVSAAIPPVFHFIMLARATGQRPRLRLAPGVVGLILSFGLPVVAIELVGSLMLSVDRFLLEKWWSIEMLGLYFFAWKFQRYLATVPMAVGQVMQRNMLSKLAVAADERDVASSVLVPAKMMAYAMAFFIGGTVLALPEIIAFLYPPYREAAAPMRVFFLGAFWPAVGQISAKHLQGVRRLLSPLWAYVTGVACIVGGLLWLHQSGRLTLVTAAFMVTAAYTLRSFVYIFLSLRALSRSPLDIPRRFAIFLPPFAILLALALGLPYAWKHVVAPAWHAHPIVAGLFQAAAFAILFSPFLWFVQKQHSIFEKAHPAPAGPPPPLETPE